MKAIAQTLQYGAPDPIRFLLIRDEHRSPEDSCALKTDGSLWCWGLNYAGELGDGATATRTTPVSVFGASSGVAGVSLGSAHGCAAKTDGSVWCWGLNTTGQLGDGPFRR